MTIKELAISIATKTGMNPKGVEGSIYMWLESYLGDAYYNMDLDIDDVSAYAERIEKDLS